MRGVLIAFASGVLVTLGAVALSQPHCPQEDSCRIDYRQHAWHIAEIQP